MEKVTLVIDSREVVIIGILPSIARQIEEATSYLVAGYYHSKAYKKKWWDGREHLMVFKRGRYRAPIGLLGIIRRKLDEIGLDHVVKRRKESPPNKTKYIWNENIVLRDYQKAAVKAFLKAPEPGRGILKMPIRSGKTKTAAGVIRALGASTLFLVPSQLLLNQTVESLSECFPEEEIGALGDGNHNIQRITVATVQTFARMRGGNEHLCPGNKLRDESGNWKDKKFTVKAAKCGKKKCIGGHKYKTKRDPKYTPTLRQFDFVIFDEIHHATGEAWRGVLTDSKARYRLGLSATVYFDEKSENERGVIWLRACCGDIKYEVTVSELVDKGYLMAQNVELFRIDKPDMNGVKWSKDLQDRCIYLNPYRNRKIIIEAVTRMTEGLTVMIVTNRMSQIEALRELLDTYSVPYAYVVGKHSSKRREKELFRFTSGEVSLILGTVFGEGVDVPIIECVINAEGGRDPKATVQRQRNMTVAPGKTTSILIDFWDDTNSYFRSHSRKRASVYEAEPSYTVTKHWERKDLT